MGDHDEAGYASLVALATAQLCGHLLSVDPQQLAIFLDDIAAARKVGVYGVGREGLAMKGLAMRLFHMGLDAFVVGEMTAAAVGPGDVLIVSAGPGYFSTVSALAGEARRAGSMVIALTSKPPAQLEPFADEFIQIPACCLPPALPSCRGASEGHQPSSSGGGGQSILPMGSSYELALQLFFDVVCILLQKRVKQDEGQMTSRHTNLE